MQQTTFGKLIRDARKQKGYSQRQLADMVPLDFTYLSKLENDRADYPPREEIIRSLAFHLNLDGEELIYHADRIPELDKDFLNQHPKESSALLRKMRTNDKFRQRVFREATQPEDQEDKG